MGIAYAVFLTSLVCLAQTPAPVISFEKTHHDFGKMSPGKKASHNFVILNNGNAPLQIKDVRPSCGCTVATLPKSKLEPGENTFIEIAFNSSGMLGNVHKSITLLSDDPVNPKVELTFGASIVQEIMLSRSAVYFKEVSRYGSTSLPIRLESGNEMSVEVTEINIPVPFITCEAQSEGNDVVLNVSINGQLIPKQSNRGSNVLTVCTTSKEVPILNFVVEWDATATIVASSKYIIWNDHAGKELRTAVSLTHTGGKAFKILDIATTSPYVQVPDFPKISATEQKFDVVMASDAKTGMYRENLVIKLDDPEQGEVEIGVVAVLR